MYDDASSFSEGLAAVKVNGKWGFINPFGEVVIPAQFDSVMRFDNGLAQVTAGTSRGYINKTGKYVQAPTQN